MIKYSDNSKMYCVIGASGPKHNPVRDVGKSVVFQTTLVAKILNLKLDNYIKIYFLYLHYLKNNCKKPKINFFPKQGSLLFYYIIVYTINYLNLNFIHTRVFVRSYVLFYYTNLIKIQNHKTWKLPFRLVGLFPS